MVIIDIEYSDRYIMITLDSGEHLKIDSVSVPQGLLRKGTEIDIDAYEHIKEESKLFECKQKALYYIGLRNRSEHDITKYLIKKGFDKNTIHRIVKLFTEKGLIDDYHYALNYIRSTHEHKVVGNRIIEKKLFERGIHKSLIKKAMKATQDNGPDIERIYQMAQKKYNRIKGKDHAKEKVGLFLQQRGFTWDTIKEVLNRLGDNNNFIDD